MFWNKGKADIPSEENPEISFFDKEEYRKQVYIEKKEKAKSRALKILLIFAFVLVAGFLISLSPLFECKTINVTEMKKYTKEEILNKIELKEGVNTVMFNSFSAEKILKEDPYIEKVKIKKSFPNTINVEISERLVRGYVPFMGSYLYIDEYGRVLDIQKSFTDILPVVEGLVFSEFRLGEVLDVENKEAFNVVVTVSQMMVKYNLLDIVVRIDVSDTENIYAKMNNIDVLLGNIEDCDEKIRLMSEIVKQIPENDKGTLDLRDLSKPIIFKYLK